jgi:hypothetical protein
MTHHLYVKAKPWMGKNLKLNVGRGDKTIFDNSVLEGPQYAKFVGLGFLRRCTAEEVEGIKKGRAAAAAPPAPAPAPKKKAKAKKEAPPPEPAPEPAEADPEPAEAAPPADEGSTTKSTAEKVAKGTSKRRRSKKSEE